MNINVDSKLVSGLPKGLFEAQDPRIMQYHNKAQIIMTRFKSLKVQAVKRELNERADALAKEAANGEYTKNEKLSLEKDF